MPVKFRCQDCGKGIKAPDQARGKTIKCSGCGTRLKVPGGNGRAKQEEPDPDDSAEFLVNMNLDRVEDTSTQLCPSCAAEIYEGETICPECGFDLESGAVDREAKKKDTGPKPLNLSGFYEKVWGEAFGFPFRHWGYALLTVGLLLFLIPAGAYFLFLMQLFAQIPLKVFFGFMAVVFLMIPVGWISSFHEEVLAKTLNKKKVDRFKFDFAQCVANGLKMVTWSLIFSLPLLVIFGGFGALVQMSGVPAAGLIGMGIAILISFMMYPIAATHFVMPVTHRGWLMHKVAPAFGKFLAPALLVWLIMVLVLAPAVGSVAGALIAKQTDIQVFRGHLRHNASVNEQIQAQKADKDNTQTIDEKRDFNWDAWIVPGIGWAGTSLILGFGALAYSRANGLFSFYTKRDLDLIVKPKEYVYVSKGGEEEKFFSLKRSVPAPFIDRFIAAIIDGVVINVLGLVIGLLIGIVGLTADLSMQLVIRVASGLTGIITIMYFTGLEGGEERATFGKKMMKLWVCDSEGNQITGGQAWGRYFVKNLIGFITWITALFNEDAKMIHDMAAGTMVRKDKPKPVRRKKKKKPE